jgi:hypothetical protein
MSSSQRYHTLVNLLNEGRAKYHIEYGPGYSNHLSHLLIADYLLGGRLFHHSTTFGILFCFSISRNFS